MRLLTYTNLFPSADMPRHGIFVEERLRKLVASGQVDAEVCALRPRNTLNPRLYLGGTGGVNAETRHGLRVNYVTVPTLPRISNWVDPILWANASQKAVSRILGNTRSDWILDAHFLYPDGVSAVILGRRLGIPVVMTARGSDVNVKCENPITRRWICWAAKRCEATITVSRALAEKLLHLGLSEDSITVLRNGVDLDKFQPRAASGTRPIRNGGRPALLSVGHLLEGKGHHIAIEALVGLPGATLSIVGEGPEERALKTLANTLGVDQRVHFLGYVPHDKIADIYNSADFTILASASEGMPNVVLESLACGTRVVATDVGGISEVITAPVAGALMASRSPAAAVEIIRALAASEHQRSDTREFARKFSWDDTVARQLSLYKRTHQWRARVDHVAAKGSS